MAHAEYATGIGLNWDVIRCNGLGWLVRRLVLGCWLSFIGVAAVVGLLFDRLRDATDCAFFFIGVAMLNAAVYVSADADVVLFKLFIITISIGKAATTISFGGRWSHWVA